MCGNCCLAGGEKRLPPIQRLSLTHVRRKKVRVGGSENRTQPRLSEVLRAREGLNALNCKYVWQHNFRHLDGMYAAAIYSYSPEIYAHLCYCQKRLKETVTNKVSLRQMSINGGLCRERRGVASKRRKVCRCIIWACVRSPAIKALKTKIIIQERSVACHSLRKKGDRTRWVCEVWNRDIIFKPILTTSFLVSSCAKNLSSM